MILNIIFFHSRHLEVEESLETVYSNPSAPWRNPLCRSLSRNQLVLEAFLKQGTKCFTWSRIKSFPLIIESTELSSAFWQIPDRCFNSILWSNKYLSNVLIHRTSSAYGSSLAFTEAWIPPTLPLVSCLPNPLWVAFRWLKPLLKHDAQNEQTFQSFEGSSEVGC